MTIGVLTFHHVYNYGALLQTFALQSYLEGCGAEVVVCDVRTFYRPPPSIATLEPPRRRWKRLLHKLGVYSSHALDREFNDFRNQYLHLTARHNSVAGLLKARSDIDVLLVGSDQVWAPRFGRRAMDTYFLKGVDGPRKISYAACVGSDLTVTEQLEDYAIDLQDFDAVSVRDGFSRERLMPLSTRAIATVVDPTLLIDWTTTPWSERGTLPGEHIFYYGTTRVGDEIVRRLSAERELPVRGFGMETDSVDPAYRGPRESQGPLAWLQAIQRSELVVTKSFHGLMLALSLNKPVIVTIANARASSRLVDACETFGLTACLVDESGMVFDSVHAIEATDWMAVRQRVERAIVFSKGFLAEHVLAAPTYAK